MAQISQNPNVEQISQMLSLNHFLLAFLNQPNVRHYAIGAKVTALHIGKLKLKSSEGHSNL